MITWDEHIVSWICGLISSDGTISSNHYEYNDTPFQVKRINITCGVYPNWLKTIQSVLREQTIGTTLRGPYKNKGTKSFPPNPLSPGKFELALNKYFPKGKRSGLNQHQVFRNSLEYWGFQELLVKRKYETLCGFTKPMPVLFEAKSQQRLV